MPTQEEMGLPNTYDLQRFQDIHLQDQDLLKDYISNYQVGSVNTAHQIIESNPQGIGKAFTAKTLNAYTAAILDLEQKTIQNGTETLDEMLALFQSNVDNFKFYGSWTLDQEYTIGNFVYAPNGDVYMALKDGAYDITDSTAWMLIGLKGEQGNLGFGLEYKGKYNPERQYEPGNLVVYDNGLYVSKTTNTGITPGSSPSDWCVALTIEERGIFVSNTEPDDIRTGDYWWQILPDEEFPHFIKIIVTVDMKAVPEANQPDSIVINLLKNNSIIDTQTTIKESGYSTSFLALGTYEDEFTITVNEIHGLVFTITNNGNGLFTVVVEREKYSVTYIYENQPQVSDFVIPEIAYYYEGDTVNISTLYLSGNTKQTPEYTYKFIDYYINDNVVRSVFIMPDNNVELVGKWSKTPNKYTVTYTGTNIPPSITNIPRTDTVDYGTQYTITPFIQRYDKTYSDGENRWDLDYVTIRGISTSTGTFTMPAKDITINYEWKIKKLYLLSLENDFTGNAPAFSGYYVPPVIGQKFAQDDTVYLNSPYDYNYNKNVTGNINLSYYFQGYKYRENGDDYDSSVSSKSFTMPAQDVVLKAVWWVYSTVYATSTPTPSISNTRFIRISVVDSAGNVIPNPNPYGRSPYFDLYFNTTQIYNANVNAPYRSSYTLKPTYSTDKMSYTVPDSSKPNNFLVTYLS